MGARKVMSGVAIALSLLGAASPALSASPEVQGIIDRCTTLLGKHNAALIKVCVDEDIKAANELAEYPESAAPYIERCHDLMGDHNWALIKVCVDEDLRAAEALRNY